MAVSVQDDQVLDLIFDQSRQELGFNAVPSKETRVRKAESDATDGALDDSAEHAEAKGLEREAIQLAEQNELDAAIEKFNCAVESAPKYASAYNNRAQAFRLKGDVQAALQDLNSAIELSGGCGKVAEQALVQRAMIRRLQGDDEGSWQDFRAAATLGSDFARTEAVKVNPYAAMCNQMLGEVMSKLQAGGNSSS